MKMLIYALVLFSYVAHAQLKLSPAESSSVKSGDVVEAKLVLEDKQLMDTLTPRNLQNSFVPDALWFMSISPWQITSEGLTTTAKVVLGRKFTPGQSATLLVGNKSVTVNFEGWNFSAGEAGEGNLIYQDVPWYQRPWWKRHGLAASCILLIVAGFTTIFGGRWLKKRRAAEQQKRIIKALFARLDSASDIVMLSQLWQARDEFSAAFPDKTQHLRNFYDTLNLYQFKPRCNEDEVKTIITAKHQLMRDLAGGQNGV